jgi:succinate dehydrogenase/fumarate reductase flavoprotein subunit
MSAQLSRRGFVTGSAVAGLGAAAMATVAAPKAQAEEDVFENTVDWNAEYDVVVLGIGFAGMVSALTAVENGAEKVLIVEKAPRVLSGGNSRLSMQMVVTAEPENRDLFVQYVKDFRGAYDSPSDETIEQFVDGVIALPDWVRELGGNPDDSGFRGVGEFKNVEGWDQVNAWCLDGHFWNAGLYHFFLNMVDNNDAIDVWYDTPAKAFIQDGDTKVVHGVTVEHDGEPYNVRALNGVVLCTGGFEANQWMVQNYIQLPYCYAKGGQLNTGDGILMAQEIGADLWHMSNCAGPDLDFMDPETGRQPYFAFAGIGAAGHSCAFCSDNSAIIVGADGTRFHNESVMPGHGFVNYHGFKLRMPQSLPAYCFFDQNAFDTHTIYPTWTDTQAKVDDGSIVKADTTAELEEILGLPAGSLDATIARYNRYCEEGEDLEFARAAEYLVPLSEEGPYYAFEVKPFFTNTMGGPRRAADGHVVDTHGDPIPHLYSAGECGSIWGNVYQGAGNIAECLVYGRISGAAAAAEKDDNLREAVAVAEAVDFTVPVVDPTEGVELADNQCIGTGVGIGTDPLAAIVTLDGDAITEVKIVNSGETPGLGSVAAELMPGRIVEANSTEVDIVAGATNTSNAIIAAVEMALAGK